MSCWWCCISSSIEPPAATLRQRSEAEGDAYRQPGSVEELTEQNVLAMQRLESETQRADNSKLDNLADRVSGFCGRPRFLSVHVLWFSAWIAGNLWLGDHAFDPFPFTFLTLIVSLEAIFLSSFILISQNRASRVSDRRNQLDLQINLLTEQENTKQLELLQRIAQAVGVADGDDPSLEVLEQATRPEKLAEQIARASDAKPKATAD